MKFKLFLWVFAFILLAASLQMAFAIEGGSSNGYSTISTDYLFLHRFNQSDSSDIMNAETGQACTETAPDVSVSGNALILNADPEKLACDLMVSGNAPTQNFTCDTYFAETAVTGFGSESYSGIAGGGSEATTIRHRDDGTIAVWYRDASATFQLLSPTTKLDTNTYYVFRNVYDITNFKSNYTVYSLFNNSGALEYLANGTAPFTTWENSITSLKSLQFIDFTPSMTINVSEVACWNWTSKANAYIRPTAPDTTPPSITKYSEQGSSCTNWNTNPSNPCTTSDTTPTLYFNTSENAFCAIGLSNSNYTTMGASRNCTAGEGTLEHSCTLIEQDELVYDTSTIYLSCKDSSGNMNSTSTSGALSLAVTGLEAAARTSIGIGIQNALLSGYTNYTDLQIYARNLSNGQIKGTFDRAAKKGNKLWAFNRIGVSDSNVNMFNLTPVLYTLEFANSTSAQIISLTELLINTTK